MRSLLFATLVAVALGLTSSPGLAQEQGEQAARQQFERAAAEFTRGALEPAAAAFGEFLRDFPHSPLAPEAAFKMASAYVLLGKTAEAGKAHEQLVRNYLGSPWAHLALLSHYDEKRLLSLANEHARKGRDGTPAATAAAVGIYQICLRRCAEKAAAASPQTPAPTDLQNTQKEAFYRVGDCFRRLGQAVPFNAMMQQVRLMDATGPWGTLAGFQLGNATMFGARMDELLNTHPGDNEEMHVFLDLAAQYAAGLDGPARARCQFYEARCRFGLNQEDKGVALCQDLLEKAPESVWATEAAMRLAEYYFEKKDLPRAKVLYAQVLTRHGKGPRAAQARAWTEWLETAEPAWQEIEELLLGMARAASASNGSFALRFARQTEAARPALSGRVALGGPDRYLVSLNVGPAAFLLARNGAGSWLRFMERNEITHCKKGIDLPLPRVTASELGSWNIAWGMGNQTPAAAGPPIQIPATAVTQFLERGRTLVHLHKETRAAGNGPLAVVYRLERPCWSHPHTEVIEIEVTDGRTIRELRLTLYNDQGEKSAWTIRDLVLGGPVPETHFAPESPTGISVREVEEINVMEVMAGALRLLGQAGDIFGTSARKPGS